MVGVHLIELKYERGWDKCMETPTKHEQFRAIICAFRKYTTLSAGTASASGQQTVLMGE